MKNRFEDFQAIMDVLLGENGCPWDLEQTHESLKINLIEECYEVVDAIDKKDDNGFCEELGDVLLQVVFHAKLAEKEGKFDINDVIGGICEKMIRRHPHIFADKKDYNPDQVLENWDKIKQVEKGKTPLEDIRQVPISLPALIRAQKVMKKAAKLDSSLSPEKSIENISRIVDNLRTCPPNESDLGNILLEISNLSSKFQINSEFALTNALETYINRIEEKPQQP